MQSVKVPLWFIHKTKIVAGQIFHVEGPGKNLTAFLTECGYRVGWLTVSSSGFHLLMFIFWYINHLRYTNQRHVNLLNTILIVCVFD